MTYEPFTPEFSQFAEWTEADVQQLTQAAKNEALPLAEQTAYLRLLLDYKKALGLELRAALVAILTE